MTWLEVLIFVLDVINGFFIFYLIGYSSFLFLSVVIGSCELYQKKQNEKMKYTIKEEGSIPVSILVPAYNEERTVLDTVNSLLALEYPQFEILVIDDGSDDQTAPKIREAFGLTLVHRPIYRRLDCQPEELVYEGKKGNRSITLIRKKNGGKADALNLGINACRYPYFLCVDADSMLQQDSLRKMVRPVLEQEHVIAVGGVVRPSNGAVIKRGRMVSQHLPQNLLAGIQTLEYDRSFLASRILFDRLHGSLIISGAFGLFHKETVIAAGGYHTDTVGEDMELVVRLHEYCAVNQMPCVIRYASDAVCWSQVPERFKDLCKQRKRWHIGLFQTLWEHRHMVFRPQYGASCTASFFYFWSYELLSPGIECLGLTAILLSFGIGHLNLPFMLMFFGIYALFGCVLTLTAFFARVQTIDLTISRKEIQRALLLCFLELGVRFILAFVRASAFFGYQKKKMIWGHMERRQFN